MTTTPAMTRASMWQRLGQDEVDVLVVGGGINGAGIARDAARRGLSVALVERADLAFGTSSRSSKLVHGGLRYLEQYQFGLVFESVSERRTLLDLAPHLVSPLGFLYPVYRGDSPSLLTLRAGMILYDGLSLFRSPRRHTTLDPDEIRKVLPLLRHEGLEGAPLYWDCATDDARLTLENALDAAAHGAIVSTWTSYEEPLLKKGGRVRGARVRCVLTGQTKDVRARAIVNATGPWTDETLEKSGRQSHLLRRTKGVHVVVEHARLPVPHAVVMRHPDDRRVLFAIPWGEHSYLGTTDTDDDTPPAEVRATRDDVRYLLRAAASYFPEAELDEDDVVSTWAGHRPLIDEGDAHKSESQVSREERIVVAEDGTVTIAGGKLTTYRKIAGDVVDAVVRVLELSRALGRELVPSRTQKDPLPGGRGWPEDDDVAALVDEVVAAGGGRIDAAVGGHLVRTYGGLAGSVAARAAEDPALAAPLVAGRPEILAQVDHAVDAELATTVSDVLVRRTQVLLRDKDQGRAAAPAVAARMAARLGWDAARTATELERYAHDVHLARAWRDDPKA